MLTDQPHVNVPLSAKGLFSTVVSWQDVKFQRTISI